MTLVSDMLIGVFRKDTDDDQEVLKMGDVEKNNLRSVIVAFLFAIITLL